MNTLIKFLNKNNAANSELSLKVAKCLIRQRHSSSSVSEASIKDIIFKNELDLTRIENLAYEYEPSEMMVLLTNPIYTHSNKSYTTIAHQIIINLIKFFEQDEDEHQLWIENHIKFS